VFRRYNGSVITPTQVLANEDIGRINFTAATNAGMGSVALAQIRVTALENQTTTAQGSKIVFTVTPIGSAATSRVDVATITTADGVTATKFTGPLTGNVTGNLTGTASTATNLAAATSILAGSLAIDPGNINKNTSSTQTFTLNGLTTSHKIIITPATVMPDRQYAIRGAWASATNTVSVEIVNNSGGNIDAGTINLSYIAFV
jgi:hypothetical protein